VFLCVILKPQNKLSGYSENNGNQEYYSILSGFPRVTETKNIEYYSILSNYSESNGN
jgi:hypothetical protein